VRGGSGRLAAALEAHLRSLGGEIVTGHPVESLRDVPSARAVLFDVTPRQLLAILGDRFPPGYRRGLERYRYGMGVFKMDWALAEPIPFTDPACRKAGVIHAGGSYGEIEWGERIIWRGEHPERPFVLLAQPSIFDPTRAPQGRHTAWAYTHVPRGSSFDMAPRIEAQIERFAPGFRDRILARHVMNPAALEARNPNYVGGDINGGVQDWRQLFTRPVPKLSPYSTPLPGVYLCSSSTPPGGGVHGMCGYHAARAALKEVFHRR